MNEREGTVSADEQRRRRGNDVYTSGVRFIGWYADERLAPWLRHYADNIREAWSQWCLEKEGADIAPPSVSPGRKPIPDHF